MSTKWTEEQQEAIHNRGGTLLVSAAAGSGKTAVLVERVLRRLTDAQSPEDIDRFLMVTYTNAAAAELRGKIADALTARFAQTPDDARLRRQLFLIHHAPIMTVHAFCLNLAREQFAQLGIAPDFRIADPSEGRMLMDEALDNILETWYQEEDAGFLALSDLLTTGRDDKRLHDVIGETYDAIQAHPNPHLFLEKVREGYQRPQGDIAHTAYGEELLKESRLAAQYGVDCLRRALADMEGDEVLQAAYAPIFISDVQKAEHLLTMIENGVWDEAVQAAQNITFDRLKSVRGYEDKQHQERIKELRKEWKTAAEKIADRLLCITAEEAEHDRQQMAPAMCALIDTVERFSDAFATEKRNRNIVDFNDLEHFAIRLLADKEGEQTELARSLSQRYAEVLVDEYQDTNAVQDAIFRAVSDKGNKLFMVGDVKQSIYSFRLADPHIFLEKYESFHDTAEAQAGEPRRVVLSRNFRSRAAVLDATNYIFRAVMSKEVGDLVYGKKEMLYQGADFPDAENACYHTEVHVIDTAKDPETGETPDKTRAEASAVAKRIAELLQEQFPVYDKALGKTRPAVPSDITILLRSVKKKAAVYAQALEEAGLSAETANTAGLLATVEVRAVVSLLSVIDNPHQDIELIGILRSPLFGFAEQELAEIRLYDKTVDYYDALCLAAEQEEKAAAFLRQLDHWRLLSADLPVYRLLQMLYDDTGALGIYGALPNGAVRQDNLLAFFERARAYEAQGHRGLFRFMHYIRDMIANEEDFPPANTQFDGGAVQIMSIHKSKGLEFPIVFLSDCAKSFNERSLYAPILIHSELGFGPKCRDLNKGIQYPTLQRIAIASRARREQISEELRILYVGMTRAKEKLIVTCASGSAIASLKKWSALAEMEQIPPYALGAARTTALWLLTPLLRHPNAHALREWVDAVLVPDPIAPKNIDFFCYRADALREFKPLIGTTQQREDSRVLQVHPFIQYEGAFLQDIPAKLTATGIRQGMQAEEAAEGTPVRSREKELRQPYFEREVRALTPSEIGTAHHLFMQFANFDLCHTMEGMKQECARLAKKHILSEQQLDAIDPGKIIAFFQSPLYRDVVRRGELRREFKFSVLASAAEFYSDAEQYPEEQILLQGVIDCLVECPEGYTVIDFKTDRVTAQTVSKRARTYEPQLNAYAYAVEHIFEKKVNKKIVYFFNAKQCVEIE